MSGDSDSKAWIAAPIIFGILLSWLVSKYIIIPWCKNINRRRPYDKLAVDPKAHTIDVETQGLVEEEEYNDDGLIYDEEEEAEQADDGTVMHTKKVQYSSHELEQLKLLDKAIEEAEEDTAASASQISGSENQMSQVVTSLNAPNTERNTTIVRLSDDVRPVTNANERREESQSQYSNPIESIKEESMAQPSTAAAAAVAKVAKKIKNSIPLKSKIISGQNMGALDSDDENRPLTVADDDNDNHTMETSISGGATQSMIPNPPSQPAPTHL